MATPVFHILSVANFLILAVWLVVTIVPLLRLRSVDLDDIARVLWAMMIILLPFMGTLAFFLVSPGDEPLVGRQR
jgi:hypothetical protein